MPVELGIDGSLRGNQAKSPICWPVRMSAPRVSFGYRPSPMGGGAVGNDPDERSPIAKAAAWAARILTVALEMVLPALIGTWVDQKLGTVAVFMLIGLGLGGFAATVHLMQMIKNID